MSSEADRSSSARKSEISPLCVVMPAYNEADGIEKAVDEVRAEVLDNVSGSYLIVVDDGSKDETGNILDRMAQTDSRVHVIHKANSGHGPSVIRALNECDSEFVFQIDSDMQIPLNCFPKLWSEITERNVDAVFGIRTNRQDPALRLVLSRVVAFAMGSLFQVSLVDTNVPCKIFRRKIWTEIFARIKDETLLVPSVAISVYAKRHGYKIVDVPVPHRARSTGAPSLRLMKLIRFCLKAFGQMMDIRDKLV